MKDLEAAAFLKDVSNHKMSIKLDHGLYKHLIFHQYNNSWNQWFEIVTWPGTLTINGDMGSWTFSRVADMFDFFRERELSINPSYWGEKIQSESRFAGPYRQFHIDSFKESVVGSLDGYDLSDEQKADIIYALDEEVFSKESEFEARTAINEFEHDGFRLSDAWEIDGRAYSFHFLWCLYAIVWGIQQYDSSKVTAVVDGQTA